MVLSLLYRGAGSVPLEVEGITPSRLAGRPCGEIERLPVLCGNRLARLGDFFDVSGSPSDDRMEWGGDLAGVHGIGAGLDGGFVRVSGNVGRHAGSRMTGGTLHILGHAADWLGCEMRGGSIEVDGCVGHLAGAAYRGSPTGMRGGTILVRGSAGHELGARMRRGVIAVDGAVGDLAGFQMRAGTILVGGRCGGRAAAGMVRGTLALLGGHTPPSLPNFRYGCRFRHPAFPLLRNLVRAGRLQRLAEALEEEVELYHGDMVTGGRGEVLWRDPPAATSGRS
ncbi:MAG: formylmethanofuran dehydrogenase subunit C [Pirellulaceae bacterium]